MPYPIFYEPHPKHEDTQLIWQGLTQHAMETRGLSPGKPFAFFMKDDSGVMKGGCSGYIFYGSMYIDLLWVDKSLRGKGYGTQLMQSSENLAKENNCHFITVNTMDFEALDFYKKLGFFVEFERTGYENNSIFYFLRKDFL